MVGLSLFSGVGGLDLAAEAAGIEIEAMCEIEPFCVRILNKRWPNIPVIDDVRKVDGKSFARPVDIVFGGFPCQDLSTARQDISNRKGLEGERSGLWFEMERVVWELRPSWVLAENVRGAVDLALDTVAENLASEGYDVRAFVIPASACGAPHRRERLFIVGAREDVADACRVRLPDSRRAQPDPQERARPIGKWAALHGLKPRQIGEGGGDAGEPGGQLNPDWVEQLMGFPEGWTNPDIEECGQWLGFPARIHLKYWATPVASDCRGSRTNRGRSLRTDMHDLKHGKFVCPQFPYEFPRLAHGGKWRTQRIRALGNAVVPLQVYPLFQAIADIDAALKEENSDSGGR